MAEKKATAKKATETKAAQQTLRTLVSRLVMFIRHWQQQVRLSP